MEGIPKGRQGDSSDDETDDKRIPLEVRQKKKRLAFEANGGKPKEKHHEEESDKEGDGQTEKQKAQSSIKKGDENTKPSKAKPAPSEADKKAAGEGDEEAAKEGAKGAAKEAGDAAKGDGAKPKDGKAPAPAAGGAGFVPPELAGLTGAIGVSSSFYPSENSNGMPIHLNDNVYGDNLFGSKASFNPYAFQTSAERQNVDSDGLTFDTTHFDFNGRSVSAPAPTEEQDSFGTENWHDLLAKKPWVKAPAAMDDKSWDEE